MQEKMLSHRVLCQIKIVSIDSKGIELTKIRLFPNFWNKY
jgi:hypothetical protein